MNSLLSLVSLVVALVVAASGARAEVAPLLRTTWGQGGDYKNATPSKAGAHTYPGCTTIASAQVLFYYRYRDHAASEVYYSLEHGPLAGAGRPRLHETDVVLDR